MDRKEIDVCTYAYVLMDVDMHVHIYVCFYGRLKVCYIYVWYVWKVLYVIN